MFKKYALTLECGCAPPFEETAVLEHEAKPYNPDYRGRVVQCRECRKHSKVVSQDPPPDPPTQDQQFAAMGV